MTSHINTQAQTMQSPAASSVSGWKIYRDNSDFLAIRQIGTDSFEAVVFFASEDNMVEAYHGVVFLSDYTDEDLELLINRANRTVSSLRSMDTAMLVAESSQKGRLMPRQKSLALLRQIIPQL